MANGDPGFWLVRSFEGWYRNLSLDGVGRLRRGSFLPTPISFLLVIVVGQIVYAQPAPLPSRDEGLPTKAQVQEMRAAVDAEPETADTSSTRALLDQILRDLARIEGLESSVATYTQQIASAKSDLEAVKQELALREERGQPVETIRPPAHATLESLESELNRHESALKSAEEQLAGLDAESARRAARLPELPKEIMAAREALAKVETSLARSPAEEPPSIAERARRMSEVVRQRMLQLSIESLQLESQAYEATTELLRLRRELAAVRLTELQDVAKRWREIVLNRKQSEAEQRALQARQAAYAAAPGLKSLAEEVSTLAEARTRLANRIAQTSQEFETSKRILLNLATDFTNAQKRIETIGLSGASGQILLADRQRLPDQSLFRRKVREREREIQTVRFERYELEDQSLQLADLDARTKRALEELPAEIRQDSRSAVRNLLRSKRQHLSSLIQDYHELDKLLLQLNDVEGQIYHQTRDFAKFIDERALWVRSTHQLHPQDLARAADALHWFARMDTWNSIASHLWQSTGDRRRAWIVVSLLVCWVGLVLGQKPARRRLSLEGDLARRRGCSQFSPTLNALGLTALICLVWPALAILLSWWLASSSPASDFVTAFALGLSGAGVAWFPLEFIRQACRPNGLADAHLDWPTTFLRIVRRDLRWMNLAVLPLLLIVITLQYYHVKPQWASSLGRLCFMAAMFLASLFLFRLHYARHGIVSYLRALQPHRLLSRTSVAWALFFVGMPCALIVLAALGYYHTALTLGFRLYATGCLIFLLALGNSLVARGILIRRRFLALEQAKNRRLPEPTEGPIVTDLGAIGTVLDPGEDLDLGNVSEQSRQLVGLVFVILGLILLWIIWHDVVPALAMLENYPAWPGAQRITVASVLSALLVLAITYATTRNVTGVLELTLLNYLPVDKGARYATTSLCRYLVLAVGIILAAQTLGLEWSSVQWLVAAMGIGLGFGLQEIFANFVSGIVLLFERPIRVGDIVTLGDTTGLVTRIRIRATTITDWDRKELIVPNKDLITGRLLNWTLSDQQNRIVISLGVAYGTDIDRARQIILDVATSHVHVLQDPAPTVTFDQFGDSALNLTLRCFLSDFENRLATIHDLHAGIDKAFREHQIEIAFPQRDIHLKGPIRLAK